MSSKIWLSTHQAALDPEQATISVFDRGFLYGDSVYETLRTVGPEHVLELQAHLDRLERSAQGIAMEKFPARSELLAALEQSLAAANNPASRIRIVVTRGTGPISIDIRKSSDPLVVIFVEPLQLPSMADYERGISACLVHADASQAGKAGLKTGNYLPNIMALRRAIARRGQDAILCNAEGKVTEGATSNIFLVDEGQLITPGLAVGLLPGITRSMVISLARQLDLPLKIQEVEPEQLRRAREIFLTSSVRGLMPVTQLDEAPVGSGRPGELCLRLSAAYTNELERAARQAPNNLSRSFQA